MYIIMLHILVGSWNSMENISASLYSQVYASNCRAGSEATNRAAWRSNLG